MIYSIIWLLKQLLALVWQTVSDFLPKGFSLSNTHRNMNTCTTQHVDKNMMEIIAPVCIYVTLPIQQFLIGEGLPSPPLNPPHTRHWSPFMAPPPPPHSLRSNEG